MIKLALFFTLVAAGADESSRSLSTGSSLGTVTTVVPVGAPVKGSEMLFTSKPLVPNSGTEFIVKNTMAIESLMKGVNENNEKEVKKRDPEIRKIISSVLDLGSLGRAALVTYWDQIGKTAAGKKQRERYMKLFRELVEENYMEKIRAYVGGKYQITFTGEQTEKKGSSVLATIKKKDADVLVEFLVQKRDDGWHLIDTKLDDTSLEETYRGSFNRIIKKNGGVEKGFPELLKVMEKRLGELKKGKATRL